VSVWDGLADVQLEKRWVIDWHMQPLLHDGEEKALR
jgi:hypothetical protein